MVKFTYGGESDSTFVNIDLDPRIEYKMQDLIDRRELAGELRKNTDLVTKAKAQLTAANTALEAIAKQIPKGRSEEIRELRSQTSAMQDSVKAILNSLTPPRDEKAQGITRRVSGIQAKISSPQRSVANGFGPITGNERISIKLAEKELQALLDKVNEFFNVSWSAYKELINSAELSPFTDGDYTPLKK